MVRPGGLEPLTPTMSRLSSNFDYIQINQQVINYLYVYKNRCFRENRGYKNQWFRRGFTPPKLRFERAELLPIQRDF